MHDKIEQFNGCERNPRGNQEITSLSSLITS